MATSVANHVKESCLNAMDAPTSTGIKAAASVWGRAAESHTLNVDDFKSIFQLHV